MSLLIPERVPVKVYKWDDADAPQLDKTNDCVATIFKACLVTGYGTKEGSGWTMPFGDTTSGVKVFRPEVGPHTDFYLRCAADTGTEVAAQVYLNMTDASTGDLKLQCATPFKYAKGSSTGKWLLIASSRSFWFLCEQSSGSSPDKSGSFFFCGNMSAGVSDIRPVYLQHTGGTYSTGKYPDIYGTYGADLVTKKSKYEYLYGQMMHGLNNTVVTVDINSLATGAHAVTTEDHVTPPYVIIDKKLYFLTGMLTPLSGSQYTNFSKKDLIANGSVDEIIVFGTGSTVESNMYFITTGWTY